MLQKVFVLTIFGLVFLTSCDKDWSTIAPDQPQPMRPLTVTEAIVADASDDFGLDLFKSVSATAAQDENIFISPLSVSMALGMTMNGADSSTYTAMQQTLGFEALSEEEINEAYKSLIALLMQADPKVIFEIANSIWYREQFTINPLFIETNRSYFDATIMPKNFDDPATVTAINNWVSDKTHGKITEIIDSIDPTTLMFLINAIYFKGMWQYEFEKDKTADAPFYLIDDQTSTCRLMQVEGDFYYYADETIQIIDLPYGYGNFSMTVFLPRATENLDQFITGLDPVTWQRYIDQLDTAGVLLELPKFELEYKIVLNTILTQLGMGIAFDPDRADFSRIVDNVPLFISKVLHKTFVKVDEEGTEAAAVTVVEIGITSVGPHVTHMRVDHPFMFVLRERQSGTILFMGKILNPEL
jgi:serpin B